MRWTAYGAMAAIGMLAACSSPAPDAAPANRTATASTTTAAPTPTPTTAADTHTRPAPAEPRTFRDWAVACDNGARCTMASLAPGDAGDFPAWTLSVARDAGPAGGFALSLSAIEDKPAPAAIVVDGRSFALAGDGLTGARAAAVVAAMANGRAMQVRGRDGAALGDVSLAGASAALRYIDDRQGRVGTVTAAVARGTAPAARVPAAPALPVVVAPTPAGRAAAITPALLAAMQATGRCDTKRPDGEPWTAEAHALGGGATLVLLPCSVGAYNEVQALFVVRDGKPAPARVDAPAGFAASGADPETPVPSVVNATFDGGVLSSYAKGRGLGDCGVAQAFVWDGAMLRLTDQNEMRECRGNPEFLPLWRARVVRR